MTLAVILASKTCTNASCEKGRLYHVENCSLAADPRLITVRTLRRSHRSQPRPAEPRCATTRAALPALQQGLDHQRTALRMRLLLPKQRRPTRCCRQEKEALQLRDQRPQRRVLRLRGHWPPQEKYRSQSHAVLAVNNLAPKPHPHPRLRPSRTRPNTMPPHSASCTLPQPERRPRPAEP